MESDSQFRAEKLIRLGADLAGTAAATAAGFLAGGPAGAVAAASLAPLVAHTFREAGSEIQARLLAPREEVRAGAALAYATAKVAERVQQGHKVRDDGFFASESTAGAADEIAESVLLAAQRDPEERKVQFYGNLLGNLAFHPELDRATSAALVRIAQRLSYQQLVLLSVVFNRSQLPVPNKRAADIARSPAQFAVFQELHELYAMGLLGSSSAVLDLGWLNPSELTPQSLSGQLYSLMELHALDRQEMIDAVLRMNGVARTHVG